MCCYNLQTVCFQGWSLGSLNPRLSNGSVSSSTRFRRKRSSTGSAAPPLSASSESGEEIETEGDLSPLAPTLRIQLNPMDFDYFTSVVRSEDEGERRRLERALDPEDFVHEGITAAMNTKLSVYELCRLIVSLVNKLCLSEPLDSSQTSVQAINLALENLCSLQFGAVNLGCSEQSSELKCSLISLLLTALERSLQHSDSTATVMHSGMLPVLLRVLEDAVRKAGLSQDDTIPREISNNHDFIFATMHGALTFLYSLLQQHEKFRDFMELFRLLSESQGGRLIENSVTILIKTPHISSNIAISRAKKVVNLVGLMVGSLKKARAAMVHSRQCKRPRHKQCGVKERFHHHDLMGQAYSAMSNTCSVASMFVVLLRVSQNCGNAEVQLRAVRAMAQCGACCCLPPRTLLLPALELASSADLKIRAAALSLMEKVSHLTYYLLIRVVPYLYLFRKQNKDA